MNWENMKPEDEKVKKAREEYEEAKNKKRTFEDNTLINNSLLIFTVVFGLLCFFCKNCN